MSEKTQNLVVIALVLGSFIGTWVLGIATTNPWPVIGWFVVAVVVAAAGDE